MDPLSQGLLGASAPSAYLKEKKNLGYVLLIGCLSGMAPDLDILIRSSNDPLFFLEYHRQFTHSLIFIPFGGLICAAILHFFLKKKLGFRKTFLYSCLGYGTHGLLDGCTSYGTQLLWPFSTTRFAWNNVSIVDPLFTLPLLILIIISFFKKNLKFSKAAFIYAIFYLLVGVIQRERVEKIAYQIANKRGHTPIRMSVKPSLGNLVLWKIVYEENNNYYVDAVKLIVRPEIFYGESIEKLDIEKDFPYLKSESIQKNDIARFSWFSNQYIAKNPYHENSVIDVRYSFIPNEIDPLWGIELNPKNLNKHAQFKSYRRLNPIIKDKFFEMLF